MKHLCICAYGHSRSVALTRVLHARGHEAVAVGHLTSPDALRALSAWADKILTLETSFLWFVPEHFRMKIVDFHVGPDRWSNPYHPELYQLLGGMVEKRLGYKEVL